MRIAGSLVFALLSVAVQAQDAVVSASVITPPLESETRVLPVWSNASGRVEALLLLDPVDSALSANALDRVLGTGTPSPGLAVRTQLDNGSQVRSWLQLDPDAGLALLCDGRVGLTQTLGSLGEHCLLATLGQADPMLDGAARSAQLGAGWRSPNEKFDLSFGLSWLELTPHPSTFLNTSRLHMTRDGGSLAMLDPGSDAIDMLGAWAQHFESQSLRLDSLIHLGPQARLLIGGNVGRNRLLTASGSPLQWETAALSFGLGYGNVTGQLTGRLIELPQTDHPWRTLDIGVSWRTPWRGQLSVGARNVLGSSPFGNGDPSRWPMADLPAIEEPAARVPYVRYQQDL